MVKLRVSVAAADCSELKVMQSQLMEIRSRSSLSTKNNPSLQLIQKIKDRSISADKKFFNPVSKPI
jgi:ABC-type Fe3+-citrate transport system substrate-binding protein